MRFCGACLCMWLDQNFKHKSHDQMQRCSMLLENTHQGTRCDCLAGSKDHLQCLAFPKITFTFANCWKLVQSALAFGFTPNTLGLRWCFPLLIDKISHRNLSKRSNGAQYGGEQRDRAADEDRCGCRRVRSEWSPHKAGRYGWRWGGARVGWPFVAVLRQERPTRLLGILVHPALLPQNTQVRAKLLKFASITIS